MPKLSDPMPHFDVEALLTEVHKQDHGLHVSTNEPEGFKRILYSAMRNNPSLRCHIYTSKASKRRFILLKHRADAGAELIEETEDAEANG